jgi:hypothetical protein
MSSRTDRTASNSPSRPRRSRGLLAAVALTAAVAVAAVVVAAVALTRSGGTPAPGTASDGASTARIEQACRQWLADDTAPGRPDARWCGGLTGWMAERMGSGRMAGSTMWRDPEAMVDTCVRAMSDSPAVSDSPTATGAPARWCQEMVTWMTRNADRWSPGDGGWDGWHRGPR